MQRSTQWAGVAFGLVLASFAAYQQFKLPPVLPLLLQRFEYDRVLAGGFMSAYAVAGLFFTLPFAAWIARRGAYPALWLALVLMLLANLATWAWPAAGWLVLLARGTEGIGFAALSVAGPATASAHASQRHLPLILGLSAAWVPLGQIAASLLAQPALAQGRWELAWWAAIALTLLLMLWVWRRQAKGALTAGGQGNRGEEEAAPPSPAERLSLWLAATAFLLFSCQYFGYMTWLPQYLVEVHGLGADRALLGYLLPVVVLAVWNVLAGWILRHGLSAAALFLIGMALQAACWWLLPVTGAGLGGLVSLIAYGIGAGLAPTALFAFPSAILGPGRSLLPGFAILMTGRNVGVLVGPVALALLSTLSGGWTLASPVFGAISTLALLSGLWLGYRLRG